MSVAFPWSTRVQLRFDDVNAAGHVGNVAITRIVDEARTAFLGHSLHGGDGYQGGILEGVGGGVGRLVAQQTVEFHRELWYSPEPVVAHAWISHIGRTSFSLACTISAPHEKAPAGLAESTIVLMERATERSWPIDEALREVLRSHQGAPLPLRPRPAAPTPATQPR